MKTVIHVNQHAIKKNRITGNRITGNRNPVITCKTYKENTYGHQAVIYDDHGNEVARVIYSPDKPLSCGAHVWIETKNRVEVLTEPVSDSLSLEADPSQCSAPSSAEPCRSQSGG
jgi:hypothetical protein